MITDSRERAAAATGLFAGCLLALTLACNDGQPPADGPDVTPAEDAAADTADTADSRPETGPGPPSAGTDHFYIVGPTIVDADRRERVGYVEIRDGRIAAIADGTPDRSAPRIDARGRFLTPGLVDPHVHLNLSGATRWPGSALKTNLRANLYWGVTGVMDLGGPEVLFDVREAARRGEILAPALRLTGPFLTVPGSHPCEAINDQRQCEFVDRDSLRPAADRLGSRGADAVKIALADAEPFRWSAPRMDPDWLGTLSSLKTPLAAHVNSQRDLEAARRHGVEILAHPTFTATLDAAGLRSAKGARGVHTTISAFGSIVDLVDGETDLDRQGLLVASGVEQNWRTIRRNPDLLRDGFLQASRSWVDNARENVERLRDAGATVVPASDAGYLAVPHGLGLHRELRLLSEHGWSDEKLLAAATRGARRLTGIPGGTVSEGAPADLVVLREDPAADIAHLSEIDWLLRGGAAYRRGELLDADLTAGRSVGGGEVCLDSGDCETGLACDPYDHLCRPSCSPAYAVQNRCGPDAYCQPVDVAPSISEAAVCHPTRTCQLDDPACSPGAYAENCRPLDADTNGCVTSGDSQVGESCTVGSPTEACAEGLYCSPLDQTCYRLCDPEEADPGCRAGRTCRWQRTPAGRNWFGLCVK